MRCVIDNATEFDMQASSSPRALFENALEPPLGFRDDAAATTNMDDLKQQALLPVILGVTGHRKLNVNDKALVDCVRAELLKIKAQFPHSPFLLLTGLADGADRLVARLATDCLDAHTIAVLPFAVDEYRKDFTTPAQLDEFNELHKLARTVVVPQHEMAEAIGSGEARNRQYARVGGYIAEHSQILIAIWDGEDARGTGGTADVVRWREAGHVPPAFSCFDEKTNVLRADKPRPLVHIDPKNYKARNLTGRVESALPDPALETIDNYNREVEIRLHGDIAAAVMRSREELMPLNNVPDSWKRDPGAVKLALNFATADVLAGDYQKKDNTLILVVAAAFFLAMSFANQTAVTLNTVFFLLFMGLILILDRWAKRRKIEDRYFDYRALAEGLRVAFFWRVGGIHRSVWLNYLSEHTNVLSWVRDALHSAELFALSTNHRPAAAEDLEAVNKLWLRNQANYFNGKIKSLSRQTKRWKRFALVTFILSWVFAASKLAAQLEWQRIRAVIHLLTAIGGVMIGAGLASEFFARKKGFEALLKRYTLSAELYARASDRLQITQYPADQILLRIGREALNENATWLWQQKETSVRPRK